GGLDATDRPVVVVTDSWQRPRASAVALQLFHYILEHGASVGAQLISDSLGSPSGITTRILGSNRQMSLEERFDLSISAQDLAAGLHLDISQQRTRQSTTWQEPTIITEVDDLTRSVLT